MDEKLREQLNELERTLRELQAAWNRMLGVIHTVELQGVQFTITRHFVIADLAPLAFFHLVEHIDEEGAGEAIVRLYDRLVPLLGCAHEWTDLKRADDAHVISMASVPRAQVCKLCTAYALEGTLPVVGRTRT